MSEKVYTLLLATNQNRQTLRWTIRSGWLKTVAFGAFCLILLLATGTLDYFGLLLQTGQNRVLRAENSLLKKQFQLAEEKLSGLEASLERVQNFTKKLHLITDVDDDERALKLTVNPVTRDAGAGVTRIPASEYPFHGAGAAEKIPVD